jgi:hypothetical protein
VPVRSLASADTTVLGFLELLGVEAAVKVLDMSYVTSPCFQRLQQCGALTHALSAGTYTRVAAGDYQSTPSTAWLLSLIHISEPTRLM